MGTFRDTLLEDFAPVFGNPSKRTFPNSEKPRKPILEDVPGLGDTREGCDRVANKGSQQIPLRGIWETSYNLQAKRSKRLSLKVPIPIGSSD